MLSAKHLPLPAIAMTLALVMDWPEMLICLGPAGCRTCKVALASGEGEQARTPLLVISVVVTMIMTAMQR